MLRQFISRRASITLLGLGFLLLLGISFASVTLIRLSGERGLQVQQTLNVVGLFSDFRADLRRAESGQRGYLLVRDAAYLEDYQIGAGRIEPTLEKLAELLPGSVVEGTAFPQIRTLAGQKLIEMQRTIELAQAGRWEEAVALVASDRGLDLVEAIREHIATLLDEQRALLDRQIGHAAATEAWLLWVNILGVLAIAGVAAITILLVRRSMRAAVAAHARLETANQELEARVAERTAELTSITEEVQRFAYIVGHDLRAPLVNVMGFTSELESLRGELMGETTEPWVKAEFDESLGFIKSSIAKMDRLINVILQLSRSGRRTFNPRPLELEQVIGGLVAEAGKRAAELDGKITAGPLPRLVSDRPALEQIFGNLIDNALKYRRPGVPARVRITASDRGQQVAVAVQDNGRGIAPQDRERVFELFRRSGQQDQPGEGIGLAHVRALARSIGGRVTLDSRLGEGSTFTVILPKTWAPPAQPTAKTEEAA